MCESPIISNRTVGPSRRKKAEMLMPSPTHLGNRPSSIQSPSGEVQFGMIEVLHMLRDRSNNSCDGDGDSFGCRELPSGPSWGNNTALSRTEGVLAAGQLHDDLFSSNKMYITSTAGSRTERGSMSLYSANEFLSLRIYGGGKRAGEGDKICAMFSKFYHTSPSLPLLFFFRADGSPFFPKLCAPFPSSHNNEEKIKMFALFLKRASKKSPQIGN